VAFGLSDDIKSSTLDDLQGQWQPVRSAPPGLLVINYLLTCRDAANDDG